MHELKKNIAYTIILDLYKIIQYNLSKYKYFIVYLLYKID